MGQLAVKVCYTKGAEWVDELVQYIYENVKYMSKFVKENFPKAKMVEPEGTYLVWVDFSGYGFSNEELEHLMLEEAKLSLDSGIISDRRPLSLRDSMLPARVRLWNRH